MAGESGAHHGAADVDQEVELRAQEAGAADRGESGAEGNPSRSGHHRIAAVEDLFGISNPEKLDDGYVTFEFTNKNITYLRESCETRGSKCTSIDAFVKSNKIGIGIEWKYTETDFDTTKAKDYWKQRYIERYKPLLKNSNIIENDTLISCQMYYELMRQTLLLEQMTLHDEIPDYKNIVVCPKGNKELFECCNNWKSNLKDDKKFEIIDPQELLANIDSMKYQPLIDYLSIRYWND